MLDPWIAPDERLAPCTAASAISVWMCVWVGECDKCCEALWAVSRLEKRYRNANPFYLPFWLLVTHGSSTKVSDMEVFRLTQPSNKPTAGTVSSVILPHRRSASRNDARGEPTVWSVAELLYLMLDWERLVFFTYWKRWMLRSECWFGEANGISIRGIGKLDLKKQFYHHSL